MQQAGLRTVIEIIRSRGAAAQICVIRDGRVVLDEAIGCQPDALFWTFSASKPYLAVLVHQLAEQGRLRLDDRVAGHWPEFGRNGKESITIRQVLRHRAGLPSGGSAFGDALAMTDWNRSVRRIERARPRWVPGTVPAYSPIAYGFVLGELVRRVTGTPVADLMRSGITHPLAVRDTHLGLAGPDWSRHVPLRCDAPAGPLVQAIVNRRATRQAVIPAAGVSTTARDLARFYLMLLRGGQGAGGDVVSPATIAQAVTPTSDGELDRTTRSPIRWSQGFQLGGPRFVAGAISPMGTKSSPRAFGHNGSNCCVGWADPDRGIAFAYLTNRIGGPAADIRHHAAVADHVLAAWPG